MDMKSFYAGVVVATVRNTPFDENICYEELEEETENIFEGLIVCLEEKRLQEIMKESQQEIEEMAKNEGKTLMQFFYQDRFPHLF